MFERLNLGEVWHGVKFSVFIGSILMVAGVLGGIYAWNHPPISTIRSDVKLTFNDVNGFLNSWKIVTAMQISGKTEEFIGWVYGDKSESNKGGSTNDTTTKDKRGEER
jgi:hypothetical protein